MSILIYVQKSTIWVQSRLCASNRLEMALVWSWSCSFKNGKKKEDFFFSYPSIFELLSNFSKKWWKHADCTTGLLLSSSFIISWISGQIQKAKWTNFEPKVTKFQQIHNNYLGVVINKGILAKGFIKLRWWNLYFRLSTSCNKNKKVDR